MMAEALEARPSEGIQTTGGEVKSIEREKEATLE